MQLRWASLNQWVLWTGRELMVGGVEQGPGGGTRAGAYDPATNQWRLLPRSPRLTGGPDHLQARTAMWAGSRPLVWNFWSPDAHTANNRDAVTARPEAEPDGIDLWAYNPATDRWTVLPDPPDQVRRMVAGASMVWTGQEVVIASAQTAQQRTVTRAGRYDPDRARWTPIAPPPRPRGANPGRVTLEWTGSAVVEPGNAVYDPAADRWLPLPAEPDQATPPLIAQSPARALLRVHARADGAVQVYVLEPDRPPATPDAAGPPRRQSRVRYSWCWSRPGCRSCWIGGCGQQPHETLFAAALCDPYRRGGRPPQARPQPRPAPRRWIGRCRPRRSRSLLEPAHDHSAASARANPTSSGPPEATRIGQRSERSSGHEK